MLARFPAQERLQLELRYDRLSHGRSFGSPFQPSCREVSPPELLRAAPSSATVNRYANTSGPRPAVRFQERSLAPVYRVSVWPHAEQDASVVEVLFVLLCLLVRNSGTDQSTHDAAGGPSGAKTGDRGRQRTSDERRSRSARAHNCATLRVAVIPARIVPRAPRWRRL